MGRRALRGLLAVLVALVPALLGTVAALLFTEPGASTLGRVVGGELSRVFRASVTLARVDGSFLRGVTLHGLVIRDTTGEPFAMVPRLSVTYQVPNLLANRFVFTDVVLEQPDIRIIRRSNGRYNYQEIFKLNEGPPGGGPGPLIEFRDLAIRGGRIELRLPWRPPDSLTDPAQRDSALAAERAKPGREIRTTPDGLRRILRFEELDARLGRLLLSSPTREPLTFSIDSLASVLSDPQVTITDLAADGWQRADTLAFTLHRAALPDTRVQGGGRVTWPRGPILFDFQLMASRVNLVDLRWISPDFPAMTGRGEVVADSRSDFVTAYRITNLELGGQLGRVRGDVTVVLDQRRGLGVEGMALDLLALDMDVPRPWLDTLPMRGTLTGRLEGNGYLAGLDLRTDLIYRDADIPPDSGGPGVAETRFRSVGHVQLGGPDGMVFDTLVLDSTDLDLRTVARLAPAVKLRGRALLAGSLAGPWKNVTFQGDLAHRDGDLPETHASGSARLDTRADTLRFDTRLVFQPLALEGIRPSYPDIPVRGSLTGLVALAGQPDSFMTDVDLTGPAGRLAMRGVVAPGAGRLAAYGLSGRFQGLDLSQLSSKAPGTRLSGRFAVDGSYDSVAGPQGSLALDLEPGRVREVAFDTLHARAAGDGATVTLDTLLLGWTAGRLQGGGRLTWKEGDADGLHLTFEAESLTHFDPLLTTYAGEATDSAEQAEPLAGRATGNVDVYGTLMAPRILVQARTRQLRWRGVRAPEAALSFGWQRATRPEIGGAVRADSVVVGRWALTDLDLVAGGWQDSLRWLAGGSLGPDAGLSGAGSLWRLADSSVVTVDSLVARLPAHAWALERPVQIGLGQGRVAFSPVRLAAADGSGSVTVEGQLPRKAPGNLEVSIIGLPLRDVYTVLQRDTSGVAGTLQLDLSIAGTAAEPRLRGTGALADASFGEFGSPFVQGIIDYADRRLEANLLLWKTGSPVLRVEAALPLDLALQSVPRRQVPGPLEVRLIADSTDLGVVEAFTPNLRRVRGTLRANLTVGGTWETPRLGGTLAIQDGDATVPGLGVRYRDLTARARLTGDSILIDSLFVRSGEGNLRVGGQLRLERLTRPVMDLTLRARRFRFIDSRRFLTLDASGTLALTGPVAKARLTGRATADEGDLHFADLITKRIVDLENPGDSGLIDLDLVRTERLGANFQSRFLDSLAIDTLRIQMGESFWLRSSEANIQLDGSLTVSKVREQYRYDGTLNAVRGSYALRIGGLVTREFQVTRGTVRYFGTPDLNAELDIEATHVVIAAETNEEIPVIAKITGTMLQPKLELTTAVTADRPALSQTELVSYLMFGRPTFSLQGAAGGGRNELAAVQAGLTYLTSAFSSEIQRALISDLGVPIDYIDIRTGSAGAASVTGDNSAAQLAQVAAGWQIGRRWFVTLVADLCTNTQRFYPNAEFRMSRELRLKGSIEPAYSCQSALNQPTLSVNRYQVGLDLLWEREY
jgi:hypothetical protein